MKNVKAAGKWSIFGGSEGGIRVAEEHEDVPDAELGGERDGVVEEGEVPASAVGGRLDAELVLGASAVLLRGEREKRTYEFLGYLTAI
jgi:hypothetical protein